jgi:hypothetical protein
MNTKTASKILDAQLEAGTQIEKFISDIPLDLLGKHDFGIGIKKDIRWGRDPHGVYELYVPDENKILHAVLTAIITKSTYQITTYTLFYDDKIVDGIDNIKNKLEAYFSILGLAEKR